MMGRPASGENDGACRRYRRRRTRCPMLRLAAVIGVVVLTSAGAGPASSAAFLVPPTVPPRHCVPRRRAAAHGAWFLPPDGCRGGPAHRRHRVVFASSSSKTSPSERRSSPPPSSPPEDEAAAAPDASDVEAIRALFLAHCDSDGLMSLSTLRTSVGPIRALLDDGDLLPEELDDAWDAVASGRESRVDVDGFVQIYREVDDLFEEDDDGDDVVDEGAAATEAAAGVEDDGEDEEEEVEGSGPAAGAEVDDPERRELLRVFDHLSSSSSSTSKSESESDDDSPALLSRGALRGWDEVDQLVNDGLLSEEEFDDIWTTSSAASSSDGSGGDMMMTLEGFLVFNAELDGLFEVDDDDEDAEEEDGSSGATTTSKGAAAVDVVTEEGLPAAEIFARIADDDFLVGLDVIRTRWGELADMLESGDLMPQELRKMFDDIPRARGTDADGGAAKVIDEDGFVRLYEAIDDMFEDEDEEKEDDEGGGGVEPSPPPAAASSTKEELLDLLGGINEEAEARGDQLTCGLGDEVPTDRERAAVLEAVGRLEGDGTRNRILAVADDDDAGAEGEITELDLAGEWELLYTSSQMMRFNNGLSGLGGSVPNGKFGGLRQTLTASKYLADVEYTERIAVNPEEASFDVKVTGDWELKRSVSLLLGVPTVVMTVEPDNVTYGPMRTRADHWKSVRAMNLLDVTYLDDDLRVMRGSTSTDTLFIFRRV